MTLASRLASKLVVEPATGCHNWTGCIAGGGYGQIYVGGRNDTAPAHRVAYELVNGPIAPGLVIDHRCRNRRCCNPDHLRAVTPRVNALENNSCPAALNVAKTHCVNGHALSGSNLSLKAAYRECKECKRARQAAWMTARKSRPRKVGA